MAVSPGLQLAIADANPVELLGGKVAVNPENTVYTFVFDILLGPGIPCGPCVPLTPLVPLTPSVPLNPLGPCMPCVPLKPLSPCGPGTGTC